MSETQQAWGVGQKVVIDRRHVAMIEKVTPTGRAKIGDRTFERDGRERSKASYWQRSKIELLTADVEAEMAFAERVRVAIVELGKADMIIERFERSLRQIRGEVPLADIEKAERLVAAVRAEFSQ